ncbi:MAG: hypothetical protein ABW205_09040 [Burkholderiales bacterium]
MPRGQDHKRERILRALAVTCEVCGTDLSEAAAQVIVDDLMQYDESAVLKALTRCRRECKGRLSLAAIIERLDDGWIDPDRALGIALACSESDAAQIVCDELMAAWGDAAPALQAGDRQGFRQVFLSSYKRRVNEARAEGRAPKFWVSGSVNRAQVIADGVQSGLLPAAFLHQVPLLEIPEYLREVASLPMIEQASNEPATITAESDDRGVRDRPREPQPVLPRP